MKRNLKYIIFLCVTILFTFSFTGCSSSVKKASIDKNFEKTIDEKLYNITHPKDIQVSRSSNPYDYIKSEDSYNDYKYIVSEDKKALDYMLQKFAHSDKNGLEEYIMAIACSEILKENPDSKNWTSGIEWYNNYMKENK